MITLRLAHRIINQCAFIRDVNVYIKAHRDLVKENGSKEVARDLGRYKRILKLAYRGLSQLQKGSDEHGRNWIICHPKKAVTPLEVLNSLVKHKIID